MIRIPATRFRLSPLNRGALFHLGFWSSVAIFAPFLNVYFIDLGLSGRQVGLLASLTPLVTLAVAMPLGALADRRRWRVRILQIAIAGFALTFFLLRFPNNFAALLPVMLVVALFLSPITAIADSLTARMAARHDVNYGSMRLWGSFGFATVAILCGALWQRTGFGPMFAATSLAFFPLIAIAGLLEEGPPVEEQHRRPLTDFARHPGLVAVFLASFLIGIATSTAIAFEGIYMSFLGGGPILIGMSLAIAAYSELPTMQYSHGIAARLGSNRKALLLADALLFVAYLGYVSASAPITLLLFAVVKGMGFGLYWVSTVRFIHRRVPEEWSSTAQAILNTATFGLAALIAGPLGGIVYDLWGPSAVFAVAATAIALAAAVLLIASRRGVLDI